MAQVTIAGFFIIAIAGGVGFGVASADSSDELARSGAFGFDEATHRATLAAASDSADRLRPDASASGASSTSSASGTSDASRVSDQQLLNTMSQRDISAGLSMVERRDSNAQAQKPEDDSSQAREREQAGGSAQTQESAQAREQEPSDAAAQSQAQTRSQAQSQAQAQGQAQPQSQARAQASSQAQASAASQPKPQMFTPAQAAALGLERGQEQPLVASTDPELQPAPYEPLQEYDLPVIDWSVGRSAFIAEWTKRIDAYLEGTPLAGYGSVFAEEAWEHGVDPRWSPAISNTESGNGEHCFLPRNAWGWGNDSWPDWDSAIRAHVEGLSRIFGYSLSFEAAQTYCPPNCYHWYNNTLSQMRLI